MNTIDDSAQIDAAQIDAAHIDTAMERLRAVSTATVSTILVNQGIRNVWIRGAMPIAKRSGGGALVGPAFTLRFIPAREDLATPAAWASPISTRAAIEAMPRGAIAVAGAGGITDAGIFGDILCLRMHVRGVAGLVTDGAMRDVKGVLESGLPVWAGGISAPPSVARLIFAGWQDAIGCGGVAVFPGDIVIADEDGALIIPRAMAASVAEAAVEQEQFEEWVVQQVKGGVPLPGLYPPDAETRARYLADKGPQS